MATRTRPEDVEGEALFADVDGVRTTTGRFPNRRVECRSCHRKFYPYLAEVLEERAALKAAGVEGWLVGDARIESRFAACPACGYARDRGLNGRPGWWDTTSTGLRVRVSATLCDTICSQATGGDCRCSCLGANHGAQA